jgi:hypothetical protein
LKFLGRVWPGRACAGANQQELTTCTIVEGKRKKKFKKKRADWPYPSINPRPAGDQRSPASHGLMPGQGQSVEFFKFFKKFFEAYPNTWKCKILQITWKLEISLFFKFYFF